MARNSTGARYTYLWRQPSTRQTDTGNLQRRRLSIRVHTLRHDIDAPWAESAFRLREDTCEKRAHLFWRVVTKHWHCQQRCYLWRRNILCESRYFRGNVSHCCSTARVYVRITISTRFYLRMFRVINQCEFLFYFLRILWNRVCKSSDVM